jgi:hypothetical protein
MMNLAMSEVMAGANFWDAPGHSMAGSNDLSTRARIFSWIQAHQKTLYLPRTPIHPVGIYFSPQTRNYYANEFVRSYRGILILLMQKHLEFQVVIPRTLTEFQGDNLILPDVRVLSGPERRWLQHYVAGGKKLIITGVDVTQLAPASNVIRFNNCPGKEYMAALESDFEHTTPNSQAALLKQLESAAGINIAASPQVATSIALVDGKPHVFLMNFAGLHGGVNPVQTLQTGIRVTVSPEIKGPAFLLPFLGEVQQLEGVRLDGGISYTLPPISKGAAFWYEPASESTTGAKTNR